SDDWLYRDDVRTRLGAISLSRSGFKFNIDADDYYSSDIILSFFSGSRKLLERRICDKSLSADIEKYKIDRLIRLKNSGVIISGWILSRNSRIKSISAVIKGHHDIVLNNPEIVIRDDVFYLGKIDEQLVRGFKFCINNYSFTEIDFEVIVEFENERKSVVAQKCCVADIDNFLSFNDLYQLIDNSANRNEFSLACPVDVIIPIYNGYEYFDKLFGSIFASETSPRRYIIIDDASPDIRVMPYLNDLRNKHNNIVLVKNEINMGFVKTVNKGVSLTNSHFVILNSDTEVPVNWLERLIFPIINNNSIASTTPFTNSGTICSFPDFLKNNKLYEDMSVSQIDEYFSRIKIPAEVCEVPTGVGFCMGINRNVVGKIGFFDESSFLNGYCEENDWCRRAVKAGYKNVIVPNLFVYHKHGGSFTPEQKKEQIARNERRLVEKHPEYFHEVAKYINANPLSEIRNILKMLVLTSSHRNVIILSHMIGGGTETYKTKVKASLVAGGTNVFDIQYDVYWHKYKLSAVLNREDYNYYFDDFNDISTVCKILNISEIYVNNLVTFPNIHKVLRSVEEVKREQKIKIKTLIHDYFMICPSYVLINKDGNFCGIPEISECKNCMLNHSFAYIPVKWADISEWRAVWESILNCSDEIVCFSQSSKELIRKCYHSLNEKKVTVTPHQSAYIMKVNRPVKRKSINIGILGAMSYPKGKKIIEEMVHYIDDKSLNVSVKVIGSMSTGLSSKHLFVNGRYSSYELESLVEKHKIDIIFIPSIWPETFSYTTEESMKMGLPVAVFNLGAPAERVKMYDKGLVISKIDAVTAVDEILEYMKKQ
ncbi:MAG TPA: glycosyltransferase, partial [Spirochaetota bacterium]|nr:glycosyltransferase [Spirochaetota bacterium]